MRSMAVRRFEFMDVIIPAILLARVASIIAAIAPPMTTSMMPIATSISISEKPASELRRGRRGANVGFIMSRKRCK